MTGDRRSKLARTGARTSSPRDEGSPRDSELWHLVEARRDDGAPTMFRIRELAPRPELTRIFVVELPFQTAEMSGLPNATAYRRLAQFEEQWLAPACTALGWERVGSKIEDGSCFLYMYGAADPQAIAQRLAPFDAALGFYDDDDPAWAEYGALRELLDAAKAIPAPAAERAPSARPRRRARAKPAAKAAAKPARRPRPRAAARR